MSMLEYDLQRLAEEFGKEPNSSNHYSGWTIYLMLMGLLSSTREEISSIQDGLQKGATYHDENEEMPLE